MSARQTAESFWARVAIRSPDECWLWTGCLNSTGYGNVGWHGKNYAAHRIAWWLTHGGIEKGAPLYTDSSQFVLHSCDVRACCNPAHLFLGSYTDNMKDMYQKSRHPVYYGDTHTNAKLTQQQVRKMRSLYASGQSDTPTLGRQYGVSQRVAWLVVNRRTYTNVPD